MSMPCDGADWLRGALVGDFSPSSGTPTCVEPGGLADVSDSGGGLGLGSLPVPLTACPPVSSPELSFCAAGGSPASVFPDDPHPCPPPEPQGKGPENVRFTIARVVDLI